MQHLNYFTLRALAQALHAHLAGGRWVEALSQQANELVILAKGPAGTEHAKALFLRVGCDPAQPYAVPVADFKPARSNVVRLFKEVEGAALQRVRLVENERLIVFDLEHDSNIVLKMHGNRSNVLLLEQGSVEQMFRSELEDDFGFVLPMQPYVLPATQQELAERSGTAACDYAAIRKFFPVLDKFCIHHIRTLEAQGIERWEALQQTLAQLQAGRFWVTLDPPGFWLLPPAHGVQAQLFTDVFAALEKYLKLALGSGGWQAQRAAQLADLEEDIAQAQDRRTAAQQALTQLENARSQEEIGHVILASLHLFGNDDAIGNRTVTLPDIYTGNTVTVQLAPGQTPQQLAQQYYDRHKQAAEQKQLLARRMAESDALITALLQKFDAVHAIQTVDAWKAFSRTQGGATPAAKADAPPFRTFAYQGYTIWVGRNAANNDTLTVQYARKDDLWLHARDVAGSHVVVRRKAGQKGDFPKPVIEYAAGLAAWFSKQRTNTLATVSYTLRKYVRKNKKMPPGQVAVDREETVLVPPLKPATDYDD